MTIKKLQNGSDIRGVAMDGIPQEAVNLGPKETASISLAFAKLLSSKLDKPISELKIAIGRDSRITGEMLKDNMSQTLSQLGVRVFDCGLASTPAMFMSTKFEDIGADGAVMITASHLPYNRNGFKFFTVHGGFDKSDISSLLDTASNADALKDIRDICRDNQRFAVTHSSLMKLYSTHLQNIIKTALKDGEKPLSHMKIVVDAGNGGGGFFATSVLAPLGADISGSQFLEPDGMFPNHSPNPEDKKAMYAICQCVKENNADLGIIFDTDVDRSSAVDNNANPIARNHIVALAASLIAESHPATTVVTDSVTSDYLTSFIQDNLGLKHLRYMRGYKNVINKAISLNNEGIDAQLAIETSGHAAFKENFFLDDGAYLATKIVIKSAQLKKVGKSISSMIEALKSPLESVEVRLPLLIEDFASYADNILAWLEAWVKAEDCIGNPVIPGDVHSQCRRCHCGTSLANPNYEGIRINFDEDNGNGWALIRKSLHDPIMPVNIESNSNGGCNVIAEKLYDFLNQFSGLDISKLKL